jgi:hypothetical protein
MYQLVRQSSHESERGLKLMRKAMFVINPKTLTPELKNVFVEVEREEIQKGMRPFEKSSDKIKRQRTKKVAQKINYLYKRGTVWTKSQQADKIHAMRQCHDTLTKIIHLENIGQLDTI